MLDGWIPGEEMPSTEGPIEDLAAFYARHLEQLQTLDSFLYRAKRRLAEFIRDEGPLVTPVGKLMIQSSGYEYPDNIATEFPTLGRHVVSFELDTLEQAERAISLVTEEMPNAEPSHQMKVDGKKAATLISQGGASAHRLLDLRKPKGAKLSVG